MDNAWYLYKSISGFGLVTVSPIFQKEYIIQYDFFRIDHLGMSCCCELVCMISLECEQNNVLHEKQ